MNSDKIIERRFTVLGVIVAFLVLLVLGRMFEKQILEHDKYLALAEDQQRFEETEVAQRGSVYVHDTIEGIDSLYPLAMDVKKYSVMVVPQHISDKEQTASELASLTGVDRDEIFSKINNDKLYTPAIKKGLSLAEADQIKKEKISGVYLIPENVRYYPENSLASHLLGFVNADADGNYGVEGHYNKELQGTSGYTIGEQDTLGRVISLLESEDAQDGTSYVLTVDRSVQYYVEKSLKEALEEYKADSGTVVIIDAQTGGVVAMASLPSYDPNKYNEYANNDESIFVNPAIAHLYEPGSIFKPLIMSAAIDTGAVTPETKNTFDWHVFVQSYEIKTAERKAFGEETMTQVLQNSDNVAMVWVSEQLGKENMYKYLTKFGVLDKTNIDLDTEVAGSAPSLKEWRDINRATIAFGQGIAVTPLEMVCAYMAIANNGTYLYPRVVDKIILPDGAEKSVEKREGERVISEETSKEMREMLHQVVEQGHSWRAKVDGFKIAAKTGTAQIPKSGGGYEESEDGLGVFIHSLAGFAPADNPRYAMLVKLDRPKTNKYAENTAAPLFGKISSFLLNYYYRLTPTETSQ
jgi:cell division protein FtsI/penicillin-binding protein 2